MRYLRVCLLVVPALWVGSAIAQDTAGVGSIGGVVTSTNGSPVGNVKVCLADGTRCATSGADGSFRITEIRPGEYTLQITPPNQPARASSMVEVRAGLEGRVDIALPALDGGTQSVTVTESAFIAPEEVKNSNFLVQRLEISKTAGSLQDVSRYVQTLPGVAIGSNDFRNDIIVRGGSPLENLFVVDNIEIPNINAFANFAAAGGTVSLLDAELIQDVNFYTGGYPSPFINRTSGVLQIAQREGSRESFRGRATLGFAGAGTILEGPIKKGKGSWVVSARRSFLDLFTDDIGFGGVPVLYTYNAKVVYDLSPRDRIWVANLSGNDRIRLGANDQKKPEELEEIDNLDIRYQGWRAATGFNWQRLFGSQGVGLLGFTHSEARLNQSVRDLARNGVPPSGVPAEQLIAASPTVYRENSGEGETTLKYDLTVYAPMINKVQAGGHYKIFRVRYDAASPFGENSPFSRVPDLNPFTLVRRFQAYQSGAYSQVTKDLGGRLNVTFGGRVDNYQYIGSTRFSPRAGLSYRLTDRLALRASFGSYYQQPFFLFLSAFPQNRDLIPFRADHFVGGAVFTISPTLRFTVEGYAKRWKDYPVATQFPSLSLANVGDTFAVSDLLFPLTSAGRGRVNGIEFFLEKKFTQKWFGQTNLSFSRTRNAALDGIYRPGAFDYPVIFNAVGGYKLNPRWEFSARLAYLGGRPYTPFDVAESTRQRRGIFDLNRIASERAPDYFRLDLRADRTLTFRDKPLLVFFGLQNVTNRRNFANFGWNRRSNAQEFGEQLGLFPLLGLDWRF